MNFTTIKAEISTVRPSQAARVAQTAVDRVNAAHLDLSIISESYRCQYPSKYCTNDRSVKRDGDLHKLCEFHRSKANRNQRKLEQKRKIEAKSPRNTASPRYQRSRELARQRSSPSSSLRRSSLTNVADLAEDDDDEDEDEDQNTPWDLLLPVDLDDTDIQALASLIGASDK